MKYETIANEIYWAMEHGELRRVDQIIENLMTTYHNPSPPKLELMSMEQLSRLANNQGEDKALRHQALEMLNRRERRYFGKHYHYSSRVLNYAEGL
jgi:hypothetical protein